MIAASTEADITELDSYEERNVSRGYGLRRAWSE